MRETILFAVLEVVSSTKDISSSQSLADGRVREENVSGVFSCD